MPFLPQTIPCLRLVLHTDTSVRVPSPNSFRLEISDSPAPLTLDPRVQAPSSLLYGT